MALISSKFHAALLAAGVPAEKAQAAAEEAAARGNRRPDLDARLARLTWIAGANLVLTLAVLLKLFD